MSCDRANLTLHGYLDGELDAARTLEFERHLDRCSDCRASLQRMESLRGEIDRAGLYEHASPQLHAAIRSQLRQAPNTQPGARLFSRRWLQLSASAAAAAVAAIALVLLVVQPRLETARMNTSMLDAHARSLQPGHLTDVASSDPQILKPWLSGKMDFVTPVSDFTAQGFRLVGSRLDVIDGRKAAVLVYARDTHFVSLFVWRYDEDDKGFSGSGSERGLNWVAWQPSDLRFCAVSDVPPADLARLKTLITGTS